MPQGQAGILELTGDASETDVKIMLPIADIPDFNPTDLTALQALKHEVFPGYSEIYVGAGVGDLSFPDQQLLGTPDITNGWLQVEKSVLGIQQGAPLPSGVGYHTLSIRGNDVLVIEVVEPEVVPEPEPEPVP